VGKVSATSDSALGGGIHGLAEERVVTTRYRHLYKDVLCEWCGGLADMHCR
jgi:hypothetical protein